MTLHIDLADNSGDNSIDNKIVYQIERKDVPDAPVVPSSLWNITFNNATSVNQTPFGGSEKSFSFNGSNQYITITPDDYLYSAANGDFTVEWFQYLLGTSAHPRPFSIGSYPSAIVAVSYEGSMYVNVNQGGAGTPVGSFPQTLNTWQHIAIVKRNNSVSAYVNGTRLGSAYSNSSNINSSTTNLTVGAESIMDSFFNGYMTSFRWTKQAVYTGNFTRPSSQLGLTQDASTNINAITDPSLVKVLLVG